MRREEFFLPPALRRLYRPSPSFPPNEERNEVLSSLPTLLSMGGGSLFLD